MKLNQWKMMEAKLDFIYSSEDLTSKEQANLVLGQIALMLAKIADILNERDVNAKAENRTDA